MRTQRRDTRTRLRSWTDKRHLRLSDYPSDRPVHVCIGAHERRTLFTDPFVAGLLLGTVAAHPETLAACLMPDHLHWVLTAAEGLPRKVGAFKSMTTVLVQRSGRRGKLWQRSFFDHVVRHGEDLERIVRYVLENPLRSGLVEAGEDYPYSVLWRSRFPK